jgi:ABC-2 type transport system permease protein
VATPAPVQPGQQAGVDRAELARRRAAAQGRIRWELLSQMVRTSLKVKYQGSALGFAWSLANPLLLMTIYYVIFTKVLNNHVEGFAIYLMAGLLPFTAFSQGVGAAAGSVTANAGLVRKVSFPRLVLPLSGVGFAMVQFVLQLGVLLLVVVVFAHERLGPELLFLVPAVALLLLFSTALGILVAALNVRYRDTSHFVEIAMLVWFWGNPILYAAGLVKGALGSAYWAYFLNPMATVVATSQRAIYNQPYYTDATGKQVEALADPGYAFFFWNLGLGFALSGLLLVLARWVFNRLQADFAEEL